MIDNSTKSKIKIGEELTGHFLVSMPDMADDTFNRVVIYICAHSKDGAMGFILNKPQPMNYEALFQQMDMHTESVNKKSVQNFQKALQIGGPVDEERGFVIHSNDYQDKTTVSVTQSVSLTTTVDILKDMALGMGPQKTSVILGYSGWSAGQLEEEIQSNSWLVLNSSDNSLIYDQNFNKKYEKALAIMGINIAQLSSTSGHA